MEITYIGHSGFLMEWERCYWLFDYYKGELPKMKSDKKLFVFVSHNHKDHFNPQIFRLYDSHPLVTYVISSDVSLKNKEYPELGITAEKMAKIIKDITIVKPSNQYELYDGDNNLIRLTTLKSTDCGVAFLIRYNDKTTYHAGDLNLWLWEGESKQFNNNMKAMFIREMEQLKDIVIDYAFAPLDPRQEGYYASGLEYLLNTARVKYVFPMHFWGKPEVIQKFKQEKSIDKDTTIIDINNEGQKWIF